MDDTATDLLGSAYIPLMLFNAKWIVFLGAALVLFGFWFGRRNRDL